MFSYRAKQTRREWWRHARPYRFADDGSATTHQHFWCRGAVTNIIRVIQTNTGQITAIVVWSPSGFLTENILHAGEEANDVTAFSGTPRCQFTQLARGLYYQKMTLQQLFSNICGFRGAGLLLSCKQKAELQPKCCIWCANGTINLKTMLRGCQLSLVWKFTFKELQWHIFIFDLSIWTASCNQLVHAL